MVAIDVASGRMGSAYRACCDRGMNFLLRLRRYLSLWRLVRNATVKPASTVLTRSSVVGSGTVDGAWNPSTRKI